MSLRTLITPWVSSRLLSRQRLLRQRANAESRRLSQGRPHELLYFHQVDDPYSQLTVQALSLLELRYEVRIRPVLVGPPADSAAPERELLVAYSRCDAQALALERGLDFSDPQMQPSEAAVAATSLALLAAIEDGSFSRVAATLGARLWSLETAPAPASEQQRLRQSLEQGQALRARLGHYLGATFYYGGEWYWGVDRLYHLEKRLQSLGAIRPGQRETGLMFPPHEDLAHDAALQDPPDIDFFFSLRSPYSAIVAPRVFELGRRTGAQVRLRYLLPMVMRGLAVPREKRSYIALDAAREAHERGIAFGRLNDPVGKPTERGLALMPWAERAGRGQAYVLAFMNGVWAQGLNAGSDAGLRRIVEQAGLPWAEAQLALREEGWREVAETNRQELLGLGLWGVPSFRVGELSAWGQDRLGRVQTALLAQARKGQP